LAPQVTRYALKSLRAGIQAGFVTLPAVMQLTHTVTLLTPPVGWTALTFLRLGFQRLLEMLWAWLTLLPNIGFLPQISHSLPMALQTLSVHWKIENSITKERNGNFFLNFPSRGRLNPRLKPPERGALFFLRRSLAFQQDVTVAIMNNLLRNRLCRAYAI
jgi:hypothetical protein